LNHKESTFSIGNTIVIKSHRIEDSGSERNKDPERRASCIIHSVQF